MICNSFGKCGSCTLFDKSYEEQLEYKISKIREEFKDFKIDKIDIIKSSSQNFRYRAEFRIYHNNSDIYYAMSSFDKKIIKIDECHIVSTYIQKLKKEILEIIKNSITLKNKLFAIEFLTTTTNEAIVTLIYHKKLDDIWKIEALKRFKNLNINIIGRSKGVKICLKNDYIYESLNINGKKYRYKLLDIGFTQPNPKVNEKMIEWVLKNLDEDSCQDLVELYCGLGNFTLPLSTKFSKVLATEVSKASIKSALENVELNNIKNINFVRLSSQELVEAMEKKREFRRLKDINLNDYNFSHIFVDPPRAGIDKKSIEFLKKFDNIIYISCNPITLKRDLEKLQNFSIQKFACFDQFAYTNHLECGVILQKISN